jgi:hypothetical protein
MDERLDTPASSSLHRICSIDMDIELTAEVWPCLSKLFHNRGGPCDQGITTLTRSDWSEECNIIGWNKSWTMLCLPSIVVIKVDSKTQMISQRHY